MPAHTGATAEARDFAHPARAGPRSLYGGGDDDVADSRLPLSQATKVLAVSMSAALEQPASARGGLTVCARGFLLPAVADARSHARRCG